MNRDPILFRVDGVPSLGWERLARCLTLAGALQRRRRPTYFLSQLQPANLGMGIKRTGNEWLEADDTAGTSEDLEETIQEIRRLNPAAVILDIPEVSEDYLAEIRATGVLVVSLDHSGGIRFPSNLVINPLLAPSRDTYDVLPGSQILLGPRYALVRPEIRKVRPVRSQEPAQPFRAMIALGDDDPNGQTGNLARLLGNISRLDHVDLVARPYHPNLAELQEIAVSCPDRVELSSEFPDICSRLGKVHFAITGGGGWSLELASVGVPQLIIVQSEAHWPNAQRLEDEGAAICLGWHENVSPQTIRQAVHNLLGEPLERQAMARCGRKLIDGRGPDRLVTALEVLLHPSRLLDFSEAA